MLSFDTGLYNHFEDLKYNYDPDNIFDELIGMAYVCTGHHTVDIEMVEESFVARSMTYIPKNRYVMTIKQKI